jgi:hypothetical protein
MCGVIELPFSKRIKYRLEDNISITLYIGGVAVMCRGVEEIEAL